MRITDIVEGISKTLYHITTIENAGSIARDNAFHLSLSMRTKHEEETGTKRRIFYLSTSRLPNSSFQKLRTKNYNGGVLFVLDGERLSHNYAGEPVNFFHQFKTASESEFEDRIYSDKPEIQNASKYIKEVHVLIPNALSSIEKEDIELLQKTYPTYIHHDAKSFLSARHTGTEFDYDNDDVFKMHREPEQTLARDDVHSLGWWVDALQSPVSMWGDFSGDLRNFITDVVVSPERAVRNLRMAADKQENRDLYKQLSNLMKKYRLKTAADIVNFLKDKWHEVV